MRIQHITIINVAALVAIFAISCSKNSTQQSPEVHKLSELPPNMTTKELGVVEFMAQIPKTFSFGSRTNCVITPTDLHGGILRLSISVEVETANGKTNVLSRYTDTQRSGQQFGFAVGNTMVSLTPVLKVP
jgi:carbohydrate-selective porin OprB